MQDLADSQQYKPGWIVIVLSIVGLVVGVGFVMMALISDWAQLAAPLSSEAGLPQNENLAQGLLVPVVMTPTPAPTLLPPSMPLVVYISGAVAQPDVYALAPGARVADVVRAAGGLTLDAASEQINLAAYVTDAQHIHVPRIGEAVQPAPATPAGGGDRAGTHVQTGTAARTRVNINTADAAELQTLPDIGEVMAQRILDYRAAHGTFASVDDLQEVQGIGPTMMERLRPRVTVE